MKVELGKIYSCGKPIFRKIISMNGARLKYVTCFNNRGIIHIFNGERAYKHDVLVTSFEKWAKSIID